MAFRFREFIVDDDKSSMRVGTDAVLLGAWADVTGDDPILEIGTGCGVIALLAAQRSAAKIDAIDPHPASASQAGENFARSPWAGRLAALNISLQDYAGACNTRYSHILANPPYFRNSLRSPDENRNLARHDDQLPAGDLFLHVHQLLREKGKFSLILPYDGIENLVSVAAVHSLFPARMMTVSPRPDKPANRVMIEFRTRESGSIARETITIRTKSGTYDSSYLDLASSYYLFLGK